MPATRYTATQHRCPSCAKPFTSASNVQRHLNHPLSRCADWTRKTSNLTRQQRDLPSDTSDTSEISDPVPNDIDWVDIEDTPLGFIDNLSLDPSATESFDGASTTYGKGSDFMDRFHMDEYAKDRHENTHYPFLSKAEWELASFLQQSDLSMVNIDHFLRLSIVSSCLPPMP